MKTDMIYAVKPVFAKKTTDVLMKCFGNEKNHSLQFKTFVFH